MGLRYQSEKGDRMSHSRKFWFAVMSFATALAAVYALAAPVSNGG
jgi:hypothetical protein